MPRRESASTRRAITLGPGYGIVAERLGPGNSAGRKTARPPIPSSAPRGRSGGRCGHPTRDETVQSYSPTSHHEMVLRSRLAHPAAPYQNTGRCGVLVVFKHRSDFSPARALPTIGARTLRCPPARRSGRTTDWHSGNAAPPGRHERHNLLQIIGVEGPVVSRIEHVTRMAPRLPIGVLHQHERPTVASQRRAGHGRLAGGYVPLAIPRHRPETPRVPVRHPVPRHLPLSLAA